MRTEAEIRKELELQEAITKKQIMGDIKINTDFHEGIVRALKWVLEEE